MRVTPKTSMRAQYFLDEWLPPRIRDSSALMNPLLRLVLKGTADEFVGFKDKVFGMSAEEFGGVYERTSEVHSLQGETDLNEECLDHLLRAIDGVEVLDAGCGRSFFAARLAEHNSVTACDIRIERELRSKHPDVQFVDASIEELPFDDDAFDTVVSSHTVEHVQDVRKAIGELRRVARNHLFVVVPRQRPYRYTFSLHTQFFPYPWSIESAFGFRDDAVINRLGDWMYYEPRPHVRPAGR